MLFSLLCICKIFLATSVETDEDINEQSSTFFLVFYDPEYEDDDGTIDISTNRAEGNETNSIKNIQSEDVMNNIYDEDVNNDPLTVEVTAKEKSIIIKDNPETVCQNTSSENTEDEISILEVEIRALGKEVLVDPLIRSFEKINEVINEASAEICKSSKRLQKILHKIHLKFDDLCNFQNEIQLKSILEAKEKNVKLMDSNRGKLMGQIQFFDNIYREIKNKLNSYETILNCANLPNKGDGELEKDS
ncbi:hypothetical protein H312_02815 [Anncaliia algerae PRA339]|uniref:Biogenesis of lysosome-related organelles complex 1 subunit KXD1 n=1 Tax=Anncaliia algerae PRA339 TaxID=1288291 RepID=A0A059EXL8_9MICR|nr:hypothetical protein H312_02815 [Anncaliia algerae PRA339]